MPDYTMKEDLDQLVAMIWNTAKSDGRPGTPSVPGAAQEFLRRYDKSAKREGPLMEGREHLTEKGEFRSDKYDSPDGYLLLKISDPMATDLAAEYARRRVYVDEEFTRDVLESIEILKSKEQKEVVCLLVRRNVYKKANGDKSMVWEDEYTLQEGEEFVCATPHKDEDFSYMCDGTYCKCKQ